MADNKPLYDLYKGLQANDYDVPDNYESFERTLTEAGKNGADSRHALYETLKKDYYDVPEKYEDFYSTLFEPVNGTTSRAKGSYGGAAVQASKAPAQTKPQGAAPVQTKPQGAAPAKAKGQTGTALTDAERRQMFAGAGNIVAQARASARQAQNRMDYAKANTGLRTPRVALGEKGSGVKLGQNSKVAETKPQYNPASGKEEQTYLTESGNEYADRAGADLEQNSIDQYKDSMSVNGQLREAYAERDRLDEALRKRAEEVDNQPYQRFNDFMREAAAASSPAGHAGMADAARAKYDTDDEYNQLMAAARKNRQTIQLLEDKKNNQMNSFWHSLATTAANGYTFTDGMGEMRDAVALQQASRHIDSINRKRAEGKPLTKEEETAETVLKNFATDDAMQGMYGGDYGAWARAGGMTANSIDFMKDILLNPGAPGMAKGVMRGTAKGLAKGLAKVTGEEAAQLWKNNVVRRTLKATGMLIGAHTAGAYISNTTGIGRTAAAMGTLTSGNVGVDEKGNYKVENAMGLLPAFVEAERQQTRENGSEMFGEFIPGVGGMVKKGLEKIGLSKLTGAMTNIGGKEWYKQYSRLLQAGGYNGLPGEALEEYEGSLFDALTGHAGDAWDDMTSLQNHVDIWLGCATMGAMLGAVPMMMQGHHTAQYYRYKHGTDKADNIASFRMTAERWEPLREKIDGTDNGNMASVVTDIINNPDLHVEEKKAALNYVRNLTMMRGYNIAEVNNAGDGEEQKPEVRSVNDSYSDGYETIEPQAMNDAKMRLDMARAQAAQALGMENAGDVDAVVGDDPLRYIEEQKKAGNTEGLQTVADYANAKSAYDGMVQRIEDDADGIAEHQREVAKNMQHADGTIRPVVMKEQDEEGRNKVMYLVDGEVTMTDDGSMVDKGRSDNSVVVYDPSTGKRQMIDPTADTGIHSLGTTTSAADYDAMIESDREKYVQERMDEAQGKVRLAPGMQIVLPTGEDAVVMAIDGDGNVTVGLGDGKQTTVQLSELQRISDEKALADYNQRHGIGQAQGEEQAQGEGLEAAPAASQEDGTQGGAVSGAPAEFAPDMELAVRDEDGAEKPAMVMGRVRYENGGFVPDENGSIIEYYMDGEVKHDHEDTLRDKVVSHVVAGQTETEGGESVPVAESGESVPASGENVSGTPENVPNEDMDVQQPMTGGGRSQYRQDNTCW